MKTTLWVFALLGLFAVCVSEDTAGEAQAKEKDETYILVKMMPESSEGKEKRQTAEGRVVGGAQHFQFGASPGHFLLRTKEPNNEPEAAYLTLLKQFEVSQSSEQEGGHQLLGPIARPTQQQYVLQRQPQEEYTVEQYPREPKIHLSAKRPIYQKNQVLYQPTYQTQNPQLLRASQQIKQQPGYYSNQGYVDNSNVHALHEARVQAALAVSDEIKPTAFRAPVPSIQYAPRPLADSSFEKELAQLVAANQAVELKTRAPQQHQIQQQRHQKLQQQQIQQQQQFQQQQLQQQPQAQYYQRYQIPKKQAYTVEPEQKQEFSYIRPQVQQEVKYGAPSVLRAKPAADLPQQYLIETTKPQSVQNKPVLKVRQPYIQASTEEPKYYSFQTFPESVNAMKVVSPPQLQRSPYATAIPEQQIQYNQVPSKESAEQVPPAYLRYYQSIKPQTEESAINPKQQQYYRFASPKAQPSTPIAFAEQPEYVDNYETQTKVQETSKFVPFASPKPQQVSQYAPEDDQLIQSLLSQARQKPQQGLSGYATDKSVNSEPKPKRPTLSSTSHSSIFVSKSLAPKKSHSVTIESVPSEEQEEEIQTVRLPPPKNNKVYTQEEFQGLIDAGYSVTPIPVRDDEEYQPSFSPAPVNYPGHPSYQALASDSSENKRPIESSPTVVTSAPRKRKQRRPTLAPRQQYKYIQESQSGSESQLKSTYVPAVDAQETFNYGTRRQSRVRGHSVNTESDDSQS